MTPQDDEVGSSAPMTLAHHACLVVLVLALLGALWWEVTAPAGTRPGSSMGDLGWVAFLALPLRRHWPVATGSLTTVLSTFSLPAVVPRVITTGAIGARRQWWQVITILLAQACALLLQFFWQVDESDLHIWRVVAAGQIMLTVIVLAIGAYRGARRELMASLVARAETAEREQEARVAQARSAERAAIAREMHDTLAHRISLVAMHAGVLSYRTDLNPEQIKDSAGLIQENAHSALTELRDILGVLRATDPLSGSLLPERPQPTMDDLPQLLDDLRAAGLDITLYDHRATPDGLPAATGRHAYRIIQECCTNSRKHASEEPVSVVLGGRPGEQLIIEVSNPLPSSHTGQSTPGSGVGLIGLTERAHLAGGSLDHMRTRDRRYRVRARLPWPSEKEAK
ncbi:Signal transduction histidine kinase [Austwickia chelonae]|uniref:histidine kinase n=1 Tax=Austwickia chelonae NBRC 105200 TaxID=1184607 RepID=K6UM08_9MICO|nr:histidine kinase [Austwickia chelonae]GAB77701.1 putative two-component histidine kinase [Austwickia chelonae NBRC 105200]SEW16100.1 Signal transduction histidine kinase [Austwickia chelonae]